MSDFDPYYQWLGINPKDQPPNHYRLLGLESFESNLDVISNAADRQMAHLRTYQSGKNGAHSQRLLNEVSAARVCLLDKARKQAYDEQLRAKIAAAAPAPPKAAPPPPKAVPPVARPAPPIARAPVDQTPVFDPTPPPEPSPDAAALGEYLLLDLLASSRSGQVFKAKHRTLGRVVAVKVLSKESGENAEQVQRFLRKAKILGRISHPNLVAAHDAGLRDGTHFLIMEYVPGQDLSLIVRERHPLPVAEVVDYLAQAAAGLGALHAEGVVHRNFKPSNILIGTDRRARVIGLGLAKLGADDEDAPAQQNFELTETGRMMGTLDYMSPEQAMDSHAADARSDIYSLGCVLYTVLTGKFVYAEKSPIKKALAHRGNPIPSLREARTDAPAKLEAVYLKLLAKKPADRYQSMNDVAAALRAAVQ